MGRTGLYFYRARYYNPQFQRFNSEDPLGLSAGPNLYVYALNSPVGLKDPSGLWTGQVGISGSVTIAVINVTVSGSVGIAVDSHGNLGTYETGGLGGAAGANASLGVSAAISNGEYITDLTGPFGNISASAGKGVSGTVDAFSGPSPNGVVTGVGATAGIGLGGAVSASITTTGVQPLLGPLAHPSLGLPFGGGNGGGGRGPNGPAGGGGGGGIPGTGAGRMGGRKN